MRPALLGAAVGAIALALFGFNWGGWTTLSAASDLARKQSEAAVVAVLMPYCIDRSAKDPLASVVLAELKAASSYQRRAILETAGWATPMGAEGPNTALAQACQLKLAEAAL